MHELLLYGQVSAGRHDQVLKILAGVAAMQPLHILERCIIYKPQREPEEPGLNVRRGGTQNIAQKQGNKAATAAAALYYTKLIQRLSEDDFGIEHGDPLSADVKDGGEAKWLARWEDQPDTGDRGVSIRFTNTIELLSGDPHAHMVATGPNRYVTEYFVQGHRFVHGNVIVFLHRVLHEPGVRSLQQKPKTKLPDFAALQLLDMSGAYILEAKVRVQDFKDAATLESGVNELKEFQKQMMGCVELSLPDRLSLDTRVKYRPPHAGTAVATNRPR
ncbi:hypothetical protein ACEQ8H_001583 [Pleosporales sp. CAS-2024a]